MHPLLAITSAAAGLYAGMKLARHLRGKIAAHANRTKNAQTPGAQKPPRPISQLRRDPKTGVYHPHQE